MVSLVLGTDDQSPAMAGGGLRDGVPGGESLPMAIGPAPRQTLPHEPARIAGPTPASVLRAATSTLDPKTSWAPGVSAETLSRVEHAGGASPPDPWL